MDFIVSKSPFVDYTFKIKIDAHGGVVGMECFPINFTASIPGGVVQEYHDNWRTRL